MRWHRSGELDQLGGLPAHCAPVKEQVLGQKLSALDRIMLSLRGFFEGEE